MPLLLLMVLPSRPVRSSRAIDLDALRANAAARGKKFGIGLASYHEAAPGPPDFLDALSPGNDVLGAEEAVPLAVTLTPSDASLKDE